MRHYNRTYRYIDIVNEIVTANLFNHRQGALFDWALGIIAQNACVLYNKLHGTGESLSNFMKLLATELAPNPLIAIHEPVKLAKPRKCAHCRRQSPPKSSSAGFCCSVCRGQPCLHLDCFQPFHDDIHGVNALLQLRS